MGQQATSRKRSSRDHMTEIMRNMHKERVMIQLHQNFEAHSVHFNVKPDYAGLLSKKFTSFLEEEAACEPEENQAAVATNNDKKEISGRPNQDESKSDEDEDEEGSVPSLARGRKL